MSLYQPQID